MATLTYPYSFTPATTISSTEVNANFDAIATQINGLLDSTNLANAAVTENKLADLSVATAKIQALAVTEAKIGAAAVTDAKVATGIDATKIGGGLVSNTEFGYLDGVTSAIQTQLDAKLGTSAGAVDTANLADAAVTPARTSFLDGMPAASELFAGKINTSGSTTFLPTGWTVAHAGNPTYVSTITHNLGSLSYVVVASKESAGFAVLSLSTNSFTITTTDPAESPEGGRVAFVVAKYG